MAKDDPTIEDDLRDAFAAATDETDETDASAALPARDESAAPVEPAATSAADGALPEIDAPKHWTPADRERFARLPPDARQLVLDARKNLETGYGRKFEEVAAQQRQYDRYRDIDRLLTPVRDTLQLYGMTEQAYLGRLVAAEQMLRQNPAQALRVLAEQYGVDPASAFAEPEPWTDPQAQSAFARLQQDNARLQAQLRQLSDYTQQLALSPHQQTATAFLTATNEDGTPKHPHVQRVFHGMISRIQAARAAGRTITLEDAYDAELWADPELRAERQATHEAAQKRDAAQRDAVARAKGVRNVRGQPTTGTPSDEPADSLKSELRRAFREQARA